MIVFFSILLVAVTAAVILYPLIRRSRTGEDVVDEGAPEADLKRRWDASVAGLRSAELERAIGNLSEEDYEWLREQYMTEAALTLKSMELEEQGQQEFLASIEYEVQQVREMAGEKNGAGELTRCPECGADSPRDVEHCLACGHAIDSPSDSLSTPDSGSSQ